MRLLHQTVLKLLAGIAIITAMLSIQAVAVEQPHTPILIPNIQEPEEMQVAPFPMRNIVSTPADRMLEETIQAGQAKMLSLSPYEAISDFTQAIKIEGRQTFYPDMKYEDFSQRFLTGHPLSSTIIPELYIKRSNAYLRKGDWRSALIDFRRATDGFPDYAETIDHRRQFSETSNAHSYVDLKNFEDARDGSVQLSIKQARGGNNARGPYELYRFELNCSAEKIRTLSWVEYDASGAIVKSGEGGRWGSIWPDTLGKILEDGACGTGRLRAKPNEAG